MPVILSNAKDPRFSLHAVQPVRTRGANVVFKGRALAMPYKARKKAVLTAEGNRPTAINSRYHPLSLSRHNSSGAPMNRRTFLRLLPAASLSPTQSQSQLKDLEVQIPTLLRSSNVPGLSLTVFQNGRITWRQGFGVTARASGVPVN